jgi:hypothetical protein
MKNLSIALLGFLTAVCFLVSPTATARSWWLLTSATAAAVWGAITGSLPDQTDLQTALNGKVGTTGNETIGGTKTFSNQTLFTRQANGFGEIAVGTGTAKIGVGGWGNANSVSFTPLGTYGVNQSLSVRQSDDDVILANGQPAAGLFPYISWRRQEAETAKASNLGMHGQLHGGDSLTEQNWLGGYWSTFQRVAPFYGAGLNFIAMGYNYFETAPAVVPSGITVKAGTPLTITTTDDGIDLNTGGTKQTCAVGTRGQMFFEEGATDDTVYFCMLVAGVYTWVAK